MSAESLHPIEETAPNSSIREAAVTEPRISVEIRTSDLPGRMHPLASADDAIGRVLAGKYRIERKLGEGAMGVVLAATHLGLDEPVAIKFMRPELHGLAGTLERFAKEAKIAARIRSEHVAKVLDVGEADALGPYIVMEYLEGKSLADLLDARSSNREGPMPAARVVEYVLQACEALAAAHAIGVIHRDVKPDNLFVTRHGGLETVKLLDFGISKAALTAGAPGGDVGAGTASFVMGTPLYMSPEQLRSLPDIDCRTDVWSMGAVMHELLCGEPPFRAASVPEICANILDSTPAQLPATCPAALRAVVLRCLEKDRDRRFQTIGALASALLPLAPGDARAYASRTSGILRSSTLNLDVSGEPENTSAAPARRRLRFQSSALVAAATVLALSALGVTITVAKMQGAATEEPSASPPMASPAPESSVSTTRQAALEPSAPLATAPREPHSPAAANASSELAPAAGVDTARSLRSDPGAASVLEKTALPVEPRATPSARRDPAAQRSVPSGASGKSLQQSANVEAVPLGRVRLVDERPRLRLVGARDAAPREVDRVRTIRRVDDEQKRLGP